ncbi:class I SAM-dependent methyltransferase [Acidovorax sp.]|uniref:class I SAM-dependent methyltransferase n=1 Tax=Acidovorax sp. TaxID=1872122 RepID=UPI002609D081|nr:class I SAM-dependent methyltransferase [Acidovorax sp.]
MNQKDNCYDHPRYYEIAFAFRDIQKEVDVIGQTVQRFAPGQASPRILQLACGPSQHMVELARRGWQFEGLDISQAMLDYSQARAVSAGIDARFHRQSMVDFRLPQPVDYVFIALGDLYVQSTDELKSHLASVASALRSGGLFLLDWCIQFEPAKMFKPEGDTWTMEKDGVSVAAHVRMKPFNHPEQLFEEQFGIDVTDGDTRLSLSSHSIKRAVYPQEFLELVKNMGQLEFIGWWNHWNLDDPLTPASENIFRPITLLRKL